MRPKSFHRCRMPGYDAPSKVLALWKRAHRLSYCIPRGLLALLPLEVAGHGLVPRTPSRVPRGIGPCPSSPECPGWSVKGGVDDQRKGPTQLAHSISAGTVAAVDRRSTFFRRFHPPNRTKARNIPNIWHRRGVFGFSHHDTNDRANPLEVNLHGQSRYRTPYPSITTTDGMI